MIVTTLIKKNLVYLLSGMGAILFLLSVQYFFDEELHDGVQAVLDHKLPPLDANKNGAYVLLGMTMDESVDAWQGGYQLKQAYDKFVESGGTSISFDPEKHSSYGRLHVNNKLLIVKSGRKYQHWCDYKSHNACFDFYQLNRKEFPAILANNKILLNRYTSLYQYSSFQDDTDILSSFGVTNIHRLVHVRIWLKWQTDRKRALSMLADDIAMWQRVASGDVNFLHKMIAIAMLERNLRFYAECLNEAPVRVLNSKLQQLLQKHYTTDTFSFVPQFRREFQLAANQIRTVLEPADPATFENESFLISNDLVRHILFRENASLNDMYRVFEAQLKLAELTPDTFSAGIDEYHNRMSEYGDIGVLDYFYNPIGKILLAISIPAYDSYVVKLFELEQLRRLVLLKQAIKQKKVASADMENYLAQSDRAWSDLFTGKTAGYNKQQHSLSFEASMPERDPVKLKL